MISPFNLANPAFKIGYKSSLHSINAKPLQLNSVGNNSEQFYRANKVTFKGIKDLTKSLYRNVLIQLSPLKVPLTKYDTEKILIARLDELEAQKKLFSKYGVNSTNLIQTQERKLLRAQIAQNLLSNAQPVKKNEIPNLYITIGLPGSGKSSVIEKPICRNINAVVLDKDDAKKYLPEYNHGKANYLVSDEAGEIAELAFKKALKLRCNIVKPNIGTVYSDILEYAQAAKNAGYNVHLRLVDVPSDEAAKRALKRFETNGRFTDTVIHQYLGEKPKENYLKLICQNSDLFDSYAAYSNNVKLGENPIFLEELSSIAESEIKN